MQTPVNHLFNYSHVFFVVKAIIFYFTKLSRLTCAYQFYTVNKTQNGQHQDIKVLVAMYCNHVSMSQTVTEN